MASTYCVSFRLANKRLNGKTYDERRQQLIDNIHTKGCGYWDETTSFFLITSDLSTDAFASKACKGLSADEDMLFVFDPSDMSACYFGAVEYPDVLRSFFQRLKKTA
ncbi:hypothetical protein [Bradyrhizobium archetypum]|uniref:Uncharacterized protein n=1 Tax=Bradyrhizobium archetypum TaxID=2721160 RepID=A0A7Y4GZP4_9BRAD|nr:hypothetical protein [Bradyrhizobium archetypum]NOJ44919.1 hypothetical protein [Bradyrhizobium archetypum]